MIAPLRHDFQVHHGVTQRPTAAVATNGVRFNLDAFRFHHGFLNCFRTHSTVDPADHRMIPIATGQSIAALS
jgi:hypothetical protein